MAEQDIQTHRHTQSKRAQWETIGASVLLSCVVTIGMLWALQQIPIPWTIRYVQADTVSIGGGSGQGSIVLSAQRELDGMVMATFTGAGGGDSLSLSVGPKGNPSITMDSASGKPVLVVQLTPSGQPLIRVMDATSGEKVWSITLDANGQPVIEPR